MKPPSSNSHFFGHGLLQAVMYLALALPLCAGPSGESGLLSFLHAILCTCEEGRTSAALVQKHRSCCSDSEHHEAAPTSSSPSWRTARDSGCGCCAILSTPQQGSEPLANPRTKTGTPSALVEWVALGALISSVTPVFDAATLSQHPPAWSCSHPPGVTRQVEFWLACSLHGQRRMSAQGSSSIPSVLGCALL